MPKLAEHFFKILDYLHKIYLGIKIIKEGKNWYGNFNAKRKQAMEKIANEELEEKKEEILKKLIEELPTETEEDKTRLKKMIVALVKHLENGVQAEIKTPAIEEPEEISDDDDQATQMQKKKEMEQFEMKKSIDELNRKLFLAQKEGFDLRLLNPRKEDEEQE